MRILRIEIMSRKRYSTYHQIISQLHMLCWAVINFDYDWSYVEMFVWFHEVMVVLMVMLHVLQILCSSSNAWPLVRSRSFRVRRTPPNICLREPASEFKTFQRFQPWLTRSADLQGGPVVYASKGVIILRSTQVGLKWPQAQHLVDRVESVGISDIPCESEFMISYIRSKYE